MTIVFHSSSILQPADGSDSIQWYNTVVNHVSPRLADGRLGSALPALWVCLRQMGLCIHLLAPCLSTVRRAQLSWGAHAACLDLFPPQGLCFKLLFPTRCWLWSCDNTVSPHDPEDWTRETFSLIFFFFLNSNFLIVHCSTGANKARIVHRYRLPLWRRAVQKQHRDFILLLLISTWRRKWPSSWNWFVQWLARLDLKLYSESCNNKVG